MRSYLSLLLSTVALTASGQQPVHVEPAVHVTAIDIVAEVRDRSGKTPTDLTPRDFIVLEEEVERMVIGVEYLSAAHLTVTPAAPTEPVPPATAEIAEWQIVIYFETQLSSGWGRRQVAEALIRQVDELVRKGKVDVVLASPAPAALLRDSRDPGAVRQALRKVIAHPGTNSLESHRRDFYVISQMGMGLTLLAAESRRYTPGVPNPRASQPSLDANAVRPYIEDEIRLIARSRANLVSWLSTYGRHVPRTLLIVTDGFDLDPLEFYTANLQPKEEAALRTYFQQSQLGQSMEWTAQALAAGGWMTVSIPGVSNPSGWLDDASISAIGRVYAFRSGKLEVTPSAKALIYNPLEPLTAMAEATGGSVVPNLKKLDEAISGLDDRVKLTYQVPRPPDGKARKIEVRARERNFKVRTVGWASSSTPDEMAEARALGLLKGETEAGALNVESLVDWTSASGRKKGTIYVTAKLDPVDEILPVDARRIFRVTFAVQASADSAFVMNRLVTDQPYAAVFKYRAPIEAPATASRILVTVEEIGTGVWGGASAEVR